MALHVAGVRDHLRVEASVFQGVISPSTRRVYGHYRLRLKKKINQVTDVREVWMAQNPHNKRNKTPESLRWEKGLP